MSWIKLSVPTDQSLSRLAIDIASVIPSVDAQTKGQYGDGIGSENERQQLSLLVDALRQLNGSYDRIVQEVDYPERQASCDLVLSDGTPVEAKLLRYWRGNGDPEGYWYTHIFSPFNKNTLLTDAKRLHESAFDSPGGLLGLFYQRETNDSVNVAESQTQFTASALAEKVVSDIEYWYGYDASVCRIASFEELRHPIHQRGSVIVWTIP